MIREATREDIPEIKKTIIDFFESEKYTDYDTDMLQNFIEDNLDNESNYKYIYEKDGKVYGGLFCDIQKNQLNGKYYGYDNIWFTCPSLSKFKRIKIAAGVFTYITSWIKRYTLSGVVMLAHLETNASKKLLEKMNFKNKRREYLMEVY